MNGSLERVADRAVNLVGDLAHPAGRLAGVSERGPRVLGLLPGQQLDAASEARGLGQQLLNRGEREQRPAELDPGAGVVDRECQRGRGGAVGIGGMMPGW